MFPLVFMSITVICLILSFTCSGRKKAKKNQQTSGTSGVPENTHTPSTPAQLPQPQEKQQQKASHKAETPTFLNKIASKLGLSKTTNEEAEWIDPNDPEYVGEFKDFLETEIDAGDGTEKNQDFRPVKWAVKEDKERNELIQAGKLLRNKRDPEYVTISGNIPEIDMDPGYEEDEESAKKKKKSKKINFPKLKQSKRKKVKETEKGKTPKSKSKKKKSGEEKEEPPKWDLDEDLDKHQQIREGQLFVDRKDPMYVTIGANAGIPELQLDDEVKAKKVQSKVKPQKIEDEEESIKYQALNPVKEPKTKKGENTYFTLDNL